MGNAQALVGFSLNQGTDLWSGAGVIWGMNLRIDGRLRLCLVLRQACIGFLYTLIDVSDELTVE